MQLTGSRHDIGNSPQPKHSTGQHVPTGCVADASELVDRLRQCGGVASQQHVYHGMHGGAGEPFASYLEKRTAQRACPARRRGFDKAGKRGSKVRLTGRVQCEQHARDDVVA